MHVSNYFYNVENIRLADELCAASSGYDRVIFSNSGAEANVRPSSRSRDGTLGLKGEKERY